MRVVLAHGPGGVFDMLPLLFIGAAVWIIRGVLRDGQNKARQTTRALPTTPWSRQVHSATRKRAVDKPAERPGQPRRFGPSRLQVMDGEGAGSNRPAVPRRFEPPPPGRRKTG
jgi:hypothetical protein